MDARYIPRHGAPESSLSDPIYLRVNVLGDIALPLSLLPTVLAPEEPSPTSLPILDNVLLENESLMQMLEDVPSQMLHKLNN